MKIDLSKQKIVLCPVCDNEEVIDLDEKQFICSSCKNKIDIKPFKTKHLEHFWHNPDTGCNF
ncbi:MAG: hypothetical protein J7K72_05330 [Candidatus Aenigmarchaeota archaeon]|nr:hypothetical protein [Candidatus Aenigmarchaeota archaeon]